MIVHSTTKYLNGHCDAIGGMVVTRHRDLAERVRFLQNAVGAIPSPNDCYLVLRGLTTLHLHMERHEANARALAAFLAAQPEVERVVYPGLPSHPHYELARRQARGSGSMISFVIKGGLPAARAALESLRIFAVAESLGGAESLAEHPAIMTHATVEPEIRAQIGIVDGLIRLSVGIEDLEDLQADLKAALKAAAPHI